MKWHELKKSYSNFTGIIALLYTRTSFWYSKQSIKAAIITLVYCECCQKICENKVHPYVAGKWVHTSCLSGITLLLLLLRFLKCSIPVQVLHASSNRKIFENKNEKDTVQTCREKRTERLVLLPPAAAFFSVRGENKAVSRATHVCS